jgi:hypothetical protein
MDEDSNWTEERYCKKCDNEEDHALFLQNGVAVYKCTICNSEIRVLGYDHNGEEKYDEDDGGGER